MTDESHPKPKDFGKTFILAQGEPVRYAKGPLVFVEDEKVPGLYRADVRSSWFGKKEEPAERNGNQQTE